MVKFTREIRLWHGPKMLKKPSAEPVFTRKNRISCRRRGMQRKFGTPFALPPGTELRSFRTLIWFSERCLMRLARISAVCGLVALGMTIALSSSATQATPITDTVFGNLGANSIGSPDFTNTAVVGSNNPSSAGFRYAIPFTTGGNFWNLEVRDVYLGLTDIPAAASTAVLKIVTNSGSNTPTTSVLATASGVVAAGEGVYQFTPLSSGSSVKLAKNTTYWVTLEAENPNTNSFNWARTGDQSGDPIVDPFGPTVQNSSGYTYPQFGSGGSAYSAMSSSNNAAWIRNGTPPNGGANGFSISITAVPEPSTYALAAAGLGLAGVLRARLRKAARISTAG